MDAKKFVTKTTPSLVLALRIVSESLFLHFVQIMANGAPPANPEADLTPSCNHYPFPGVL